MSYQMDLFGRPPRVRSARRSRRTAVASLGTRDPRVDLKGRVLEAAVSFRGSLDRTGLVDRHRLMLALWHFDQAEGWRIDGAGSLTEWASSECFPMDASVAVNLVGMYSEFVERGSCRPEDVAAAGYTKVLLLLPAVRRGLMEPDKALIVARSGSQRQLRRIRDQISEARPSRLARYDVRIPILGPDGKETGIVLHKRVKDIDAPSAATVARRCFNHEDLFGVRFGEPRVQVTAD